jgi:putative hydrolases of HD superfamily
MSFHSWVSLMTLGLLATVALTQGSFSLTTVGICQERQTIVSIGRRPCRLFEPPFYRPHCCTVAQGSVHKRLSMSPTDNDTGSTNSNAMESSTDYERDQSTSNQSSGASAAASLTPDFATAAVEFAQLIGRLKTTPRTGWVRRGVPRYESVADHSWRVAALSLLLTTTTRESDTILNDEEDREDYNVAKCMQLAIVHDLAECIVGDIAPEDNISAQDKRNREASAMEHIDSLLSKATNTISSPSIPEQAAVPLSPSTSSPSPPSLTTNSALLNLFHEYEERSTREAIAVKDLDMLDMILQARDYEERFGIDLSDFFTTTPATKFRIPRLAAVAQLVHDQRRARTRTAASVKPLHDPEEKGHHSLGLSKSDEAFVAEYSQASVLPASDIAAIVQAYQVWQHPR